MPREVRILCLKTKADRISMPTIERIAKIAMLTHASRFCPTSDRTSPHVIEKLHRPFEKWYTTDMIPAI
jgi:hypothetical protein